MRLCRLVLTVVRPLSGLKGRRTILPVAVVCLACVLGVSTAFAGSAHVFSTSFGSEGSGAGELSSPEGVAVDNSMGPASGDVYVADTGNHRVDQFDAEGNFIRAWGWGVANGLSEFEVCTLICEKGIAGSGPGQFKAPSFIAVDGSSGPSAGDVYVGDNEATVVQKFSSSGELVSSWGDSTPVPNGQLAGTNATNGPFGTAGVAIDTSGNLWVEGGSAGMFEFDQSGGFIQSWNPTTSIFETFVFGPVAVDSNDNVYNHYFESVEKLNSSGSHLGAVVQDGERPTGLAVDQATNELYVDEGGHSIQRVDSPCEPSAAPCHVGETFGATHLTGGAGLAVDSASGVVYVADATANQIQVYSPVIDVVTDPATNVTATSATLNGTVNADGSLVSDCHFEYGPTEAYGQSAPCVESVGSGTTSVPVHADISGLLGSSTYHFRLVASNAKANQSGGDVPLPTLPVPAVDSVSAADLTATSVDLTARINPEGLDATYYFEWGATTAYDHRVPLLESEDEDIGAGTTDVAVSTHVTGLDEGRTYHWRVVAHDQNGTTITTDHVFVYDTSGGGLPDNRAYEMVSPPNKNAALIGSLVFAALPDIAENGSRMFATSIQCFAGSESCNAARGQLGDPFVFTRTASGWVTSALAPSATQFAVNTYWVGSGESGDALFTIPTAPGGEDDWYMRSAEGTLTHVGPTSQPSLGLVGVGVFGKVPIVGTADFSHIVWDSQPVWPSLDETKGINSSSVYEYVGAENNAPVLVGVSGGAGSTDLISECGTALGGTLGYIVEKHGSVSRDGSVVFFTAEACGSGSGTNRGIKVPANELYARIDQARTVPISQRSPAECATTECKDSPPSDASFQGASTDGSKVFFMSGQQLTDDASEGTNNLYEYDFSAPAGHNLIATSAGDRSGSGPRVGGVVAISADGSHVYFVAQGVLTDQANSQGQVALNGDNNLYVFEHDATYPKGRIAFVAALPSSDSSGSTIESADGRARALWSTGAASANTTPDGRFLVFGSHGVLTPDDTRTDGGQQVFRYDAQTGSLVRISIGNDGFNDDGNAGFGAASIVAPEYPTSALRTDPTMSHDGSYVFFQSPEGLTPRAFNDVQIGTREIVGKIIIPVYAENVYEYHDGHVYLISDGRDTGMVGAEPTTRLLGSDATGANVFFTTSDPLVPTDTDTQLDYYDARVCSESDPCISSPPPALQPCLGEACHGTPVASPPFSSPVSATFSGAGNLPPATKQVSKGKKAKPKARKRRRKKARRKHGRAARSKRSSARIGRGK
jgi:NHL repeat